MTWPRLWGLSFGGLGIGAWALGAWALVAWALVAWALGPVIFTRYEFRGLGFWGLFFSPGMNLLNRATYHLLLQAL